MATEILESDSVNAHNQVSYPQLMALAERYREQFPETMNILDISGVSPFGSREMVNPYVDQIDTEDFANIGRHCMAVANTAEKIALQLLAQGSITQDQVTEIIKAAILHDGDKRLEVMRKKAKAAGVTDPDGNPIDVYGEAGYATIGTVFSDAGIDPAILTTMKNMGGMTAHNSVKKFILMQDGNLVLNPERTLAEMIVHIADDMTHSPNPDIENPTIVTSLWERAKLGRFPERYAFLWQEGLGIYMDGSIRDLRDIVEHKKTPKDDIFITYYEGMQIAFELICSHLQNLIDPMSSIDSEQFIVGLANKKASDVQDGVSQKVDDVL